MDSNVIYYGYYAIAAILVLVGLTTFTTFLLTRRYYRGITEKRWVELEEMYQQKVYAGWRDNFYNLAPGTYTLVQSYEPRRFKDIRGTYVGAIVASTVLKEIYLLVPQEQWHVANEPVQNLPIVVAVYQINIGSMPGDYKVICKDTNNTST